MASTRWPPQNELNGIFGGFSLLLLLFHLILLWLGFYIFIFVLFYFLILEVCCLYIIVFNIWCFYGISLFSYVCISVSICVSCVFSLALVFIFVCFVQIRFACFYPILVCFPSLFLDAFLFSNEKAEKDTYFVECRVERICELEGEPHSQNRLHKKYLVSIRNRKSHSNPVCSWIIILSLLWRLGTT